MKIKVMIIFILILLIVVGCSNDEQVNLYEEKIGKLESELDEVKFDKNSLEKKLDQLKIKDVENENLLNLFDQKTIGYLGMSQHGDLFIITVIDGKDSGTYIYRNEIGSVQKITDFPYEPIWSPNKEYVLIVQGTSIQSSCQLIAEDSSKENMTIAYVGRVFWISDVELIYARSNNEILLKPITELEYTTDVVVNNVINGNKNVLLEGTKEYNFFPIKLLEDMKIECVKCYLESPSDRETIIIDITN
jgi:hypothetical protein